MGLRKRNRDDAAPVRSADAAAWVRPLCHEVGNFLAGIRLCAHLLHQAEDRAERQRTSREVELLAAQAGALLAQMRPLFEQNGESRVRITTESLLASASGAVAEEVPEGVRWTVARGRNLPDVRVDTEALHHLLVTLLLGALEAVAPHRGRVRLAAESSGRHVVLTLTDDAAPIDLRDRPEVARGRELAVRLAATVLKPSGARVRLAAGRRRGNRIELWLAAAGAGRATKTSRVAPRSAD